MNAQQQGHPCQSYVLTRTCTICGILMGNHRSKGTILRNVMSAGKTFSVEMLVNNVLSKYFESQDELIPKMHLAVK